MNYLAHLHLADEAKSSLLGNLLGDFVKGQLAEQYSLPVMRGIRLHRWVDSYTDQHPLVLQLKPRFPQHLRRFSPIALDMFWDHCLAKHWSQFSALSLAHFSVDMAEQVEQEIALVPEALPKAFLTLNQKIWAQQWLMSYQSMDNLCYALERIASRRIRLQPLACCGAVLQRNYAQFEAHFFDFYPQLLRDSKRTAQDLV